MDTVIIIVGPSCSGKSTLAAYLSNHGIPEVQSFTTREPRPGESTGSNAPYRFVDHKWVSFLDPDCVVEQIEFNGSVYGTTDQQLRSALRNGRGVAAVIVEPEGAKQWIASAEKHGYRPYTIYLDQTLPVLVRRFSERLKTAAPGKLQYELMRFNHMINIESQEWPKALKYDMVVRDLGEKSSMSGTTMEMIYGFLKVKFQR